MILYDKLENETTKEYVYRVIKNNIMSLELRPGQLISEIDLASKLNVSRTPIREVLIRLKGEKLIEVKPQIGTFVSLIDWKLVGDAVFVRCTLEKEALREACKQFDEKCLLEMEQCLVEQELIKNQKNNVLAFHTLDKRFHQRLFEGIDRASAWETISNMRVHYSRMRLLAEMNLSKEFIVEEHARYLEIIKQKKIEEIEEVVTGHIGKQLSVWKELIDSSEYVAKYIKNK